jgi:hypothetical protein
VNPSRIAPLTSFLAWRIRGGAINVAIMNKTELPQETIWRPFLYGNALRFSARMKALLFAAILALTLGMQTPIVIAGGTNVHSPLTVQQAGTGTIPQITVSGANTAIPLAIRPKGNSFLQLGPDTYGVAGWAGSDLGLEYRNRGTVTANSFYEYIEMFAGDHANGSLIGSHIDLFTKNNAVNNTDQLIGSDVSSYPYLPAGKTMEQAVGAQAQVESHNSGTINSAYGTQGFVTARDSSHINVAIGVNGAISAVYYENGSIDVALSYQSVLGDLSRTSGAGGGANYAAFNVNSVPMEILYVLYGSDLTGKATNAYFLWNDSPGVFLVNGAGVTQYYNPSFSPKYTPGATAFERGVQQWNSNVLEYGTEAGSTGGTLRGVRIIGESVEVASGLMKLTPRSRPSAPTEGMIYPDSSDHHLYFYNGTTWKQLDN